MNIHALQRKKTAREKICVLTCYDYPSAKIINETPVEAVLVGDSLAMTVHGHETTVTATMEMMVLHTQAVKRGLDKKLLIADMPFLSYQGSIDATLNNVKALMQAGAHAIKMEGASTSLCQTIETITASGVPVVGHIGLTPQSVHGLGGYKVQGRDEHQAKALLESALALEAAGCFAVVLECVPTALAKKITERLSIPTIGIGAGSDTDGQVLVWHDMLGLQSELNPKFVKQFIDGKACITKAINSYANEVKAVTFPCEEHSYA